MNLDLSEEEVKFIKDLAHELKTQNNRATSPPYYYTVRQTKRIVGMDANYSNGETVWVNMADDYEEHPTYDAAVAAVMKNLDYTKEDAEEYVTEGFEEFGYHEYEYDTNVFLTYKGFLEHMRLNAHNYPGKQDGDHYTPADDKANNRVFSYVQYAFRNPEMTQLISLIKKIGDQL